MSGGGPMPDGDNSQSLFILSLLLIATALAYFRRK